MLMKLGNFACLLQVLASNLGGCYFPVRAGRQPEPSEPAARHMAEQQSWPVLKSYDICCHQWELLLGENHLLLNSSRGELLLAACITAEITGARLFRASNAFNHWLLTPDT